jgi:flagellar motor switch protein FliN/FliY
MADDRLEQDEIERLLAEAQQASGKAPAPATPASPAKPAAPQAPKSATLDQSELDAMLAGLSASPPPAVTITKSPPVKAVSPDAVSQDDIELLLNQAEAAIASIDTPVELPPGVLPFRLDDFGGTPASSEAATLELVRDVQLDLKIELGRTHMHLEDVLRLRQGAVVPLDKLAGDPVDLYVNGRMIARGEVLVLNDNFCVRVTELIVGDSACA